VVDKFGEKKIALSVIAMCTCV